MNFILKNIRVLLSFSLLIFLFLLSVNPTMTPARVTHKHEVSPESLKRHVETISSFVGRNLNEPAVLNRTADYIIKEWTEAGFSIEEQRYVVNGVEVKNLTVSYNKRINEIQNTIVVGAHYDVFSTMPGADDNASGVAGLIELSKLVKATAPKISQRIDFVAYTLEEPPYYDTEAMGSLVHAQKMKKDGRKIDLMISFEMIGYFSDAEDSQNYPIPYLMDAMYSSKGNFVAFVGGFKEWAIMRKVKHHFQEYADLPILSINTTKYMEGIDWSDHRSYWAEGYPAIMVTDTSYMRNPNYHTVSDLPETLDYKRMAKVVVGTYGAIINLK